MSDLIHELLFRSAQRTPGAEALVYGQRRLNYADGRGARHGGGAAGFRAGQGRTGRDLPRQAPRNRGGVLRRAAAGGVFVPVNPLLKAEQVAYILRDCNVRVLVTSAERLASARSDVLATAPTCALSSCVGDAGERPACGVRVLVAGTSAIARRRPRRRTASIDTDMAAILYTSGSTGKPKGVVLSHRNMVAGAKSVAQYLGKHARRPAAGGAAAVASTPASAS